MHKNTKVDAVEVLSLCEQVPACISPCLATPLTPFTKAFFVAVVNLIYRCLTSGNNFRGLTTFTLKCV